MATSDADPLEVVDVCAIAAAIVDPKLRDHVYSFNLMPIVRH